MGVGPYSAEENGRIAYRGNNVFPPLHDVREAQIPTQDLEQRTTDIHTGRSWSPITRINHTIHRATNAYFDALGAQFMLLPLTTRMISSPGAVYGKEAIRYTTDTCPITLDWFDMPTRAFLSESSQIYLELSLLQAEIDQVYAIYHSFRKEESDATHLSEFHHTEYEGHVNQEQNLRIAKGLIDCVLTELIGRNEADLRVFLSPERIQSIASLIGKPLRTVTLDQALSILREDTGDDKYAQFTLQHFGAWEEIRLTQCLGGIVAVSEMPLLEVPFYHATKQNSERTVADNADIIWPGYREIIGSGERVRTQKELEAKAELFRLPREDYQPYLQSRELACYRTSAGFGMGWERLLQGVLEMPFIHSASLFPRVHTTLRP